MEKHFRDHSGKVSLNSNGTIVPVGAHDNDGPSNFIHDNRGHVKIYNIIKSISYLETEEVIIKFIGNPDKNHPILGYAKMYESSSTDDIITYSFLQKKKSWKWYTNTYY